MRSALTPIGGNEIELRIRKQPALGRAEAWLTEIHEFRGKVMYDNGRRPYFCDDVGRYVDADEVDFGSWHMTAHLWSEDRISACVRLVPPELTTLFHTRRHLGAERYDEVLRMAGAVGGPVLEVSRLVVSRRVRGDELADKVMAAVVAVGRAMGAGLLIAQAATESGWHGRLGWVDHPETDRYVPLYSDTVRVVSYRIEGGTPEYEQAVTDLCEGLSGVLRREVDAHILHL
ncbi:hypothetical protein GCM10010517_30250 [Streptosporangium fragile]|uniref:GNAT family N-acetyltransferase n=1 Tax=Streptosporangium fragile TaxID=46186 RepID=A0ABN3VX58_9ACTN